ncbi:MAG: hypothetical protein AB1689_16090, partial [Thermodesulfobacteriota bacterium]
RVARYVRAGFRVVDPRRVAYLQPDFRAAEAIDASGLAPLPLLLLVRDVGHEARQALSGGELRTMIDALYAMYGVHQRAGDMAPLRARLAELPAPGEKVALLDHVA